MRQAGGESEIRCGGVIDLEGRALGKIKAERHQQDAFNLARDIAQFRRQNALAGLRAALLLTHHADAGVFLVLTGNSPVLIGFLQIAGAAGKRGSKGRSA